MQDIGQLRLDRNDASSPPPPPAGEERRWVLWAGLGLLVAAGVALYILWRPTAEDAPREAITETRPALGEPHRVADLPAEPGDEIPLMPLPETDPLVRELVARLSSHPTAAAWLTTDQLLRNFTVVTLNIANGRSPAGHLRSVPPAGTFRVQGDEPTLAIDPRSYARYDAHADAVAALDARGTARLYATLEPRIEDAYREQGFPEGGFRAVLERAFVELLRTPIVEGPVRVVPRPVTYAFADARLESLSAAQRQFLRMGPRNVRIVQEKLREIAPFLGIPEERLPRPTRLDLQ